MCRHLAYLGAPRTLRELLIDPPYGLYRQSWAPRYMRGTGTVNADGFGIGWYVSDLAEPVRYRRAVPIWGDSSLPGLAAATRTGAVLAAVRSATTGMPVAEGASAPFGEGPWLFSHNGAVGGWPDSVAALASALPVRDLLTLDAPTDSALLWALVRARLRDGLSTGKALADVVGAVGAAAPGRLNLLLTDGTSIAATTWGDSLYHRQDRHGLTVASEPDDDGRGWTEVPDHTLVTADRSGISLTALEER
ncbi:MAG TPA: ergothioneine biosynthesis protein EgtC [Mycobacteriales bacterium]|nr:ergothioneine biosynthesis protein EgtC [Mycobacteriales bacterium]